MPQSIVLFNLRNKIRSLLCDGEPFDRSDFYASIEYIRRIFVFRLILNCLGIQITSRRYQLALRSSNDSHQSPSIFNSYRKHKHKVRFNVCEKQSLSCEITVQIPLNIHKQVQQSEKVMSNDERNDTKTSFLADLCARDKRSPRHPSENVQHYQRSSAVVAVCRVHSSIARPSNHGPRNAQQTHFINLLNQF